MAELSPFDRDLSDAESIEGSENDTQFEEAARLTVGDFQRVLHPLRETADRVGKQVEHFAENLDRLSRKTRRPPAHPSEHFLPIIEAYKGISTQTVQRLSRVHAPGSTDWKKRLRSSVARTSRLAGQSGDGDSLSSETTVEDLRRWQAEEQTWTLFSLMLQIRYPSDPKKQDLAASTRVLRPSIGNGIHQYSSEQEIWNSYLANDDIAWERHVITHWLQQYADETSPNVESTVQGLEQDANRGDGLWAHGWLYSKEAIKAHKRLRSGTVSDSITTSDRSQPLVTQLDPDATSRQGRSLEMQDQSFEQAIWRACWEMLRRGKDWTFIREWCKERVEGWRAVAMLGDPRNSTGTNNLRSRVLWRKACSVASLHSDVDRYENAVYGALSGNMNSVIKICQSWEDFLFCYHNCYLIRGFDEYTTRALPQCVAPSLGQSFGIADTVSSPLLGKAIVEKLQIDSSSRDQANEPMRMLQGSLIAKDLENFIIRYGSNLLNSVRGTDDAKLFPTVDTDTSCKAVGKQDYMNDYDLLRMLTHMLFLLYDLGLKITNHSKRVAAESVAVAYINFLSKAGKLELLPLYASRLHEDTASHCLARQFPRIRENRDRSTVLALLKQDDIDTSQIFIKQIQLIIEDNSDKVMEPSVCPALSILSNNAQSRTQWRELKANFLTLRINDPQMDLIQGFQWYLLDGTWTAAMRAGVNIYKYFLRTGALSAARDLCQTVTFSQLSLAKTQESFGRRIDLTESPTEAAIVPESMETQRKRMLDQSKSFRDFEALFVVLDALQEWRRLVPASSGKKVATDHERMRGVRQATQEAYTTIRPMMDSLLHDWLGQPADEQEAQDFVQIRRACLPDVIIAYINFLARCSKYLTRSHLLDCMDLVPCISASAELTDCFVQTQRMSELVDAFALASVTMVQAEESGSKAPKKTRDGRSLTLWSTTATKR